PRHASRLGQSASAGRLDERSGPWPNGSLAVEHRTDGEYRRVQQIRTSHAAHRVHLIRIVEERRDASTVHDQFSADATPPAEKHRAGRCWRVLDEPESRVAPPDGFGL